MTISEKAIEMLSGNNRKTQLKIYPRAFKKNVEIWSRKLPKIDPRASWATLAKTNGLQARLKSSHGAFLNIFGAPRNIFQAIITTPGHPKTALGAAWAHFWRPKYRSKNRPKAILANLSVPERFGEDFRYIFDRFCIIFIRLFGRPWCGL